MLNKARKTIAVAMFAAIPVVFSSVGFGQGKPGEAPPRDERRRPQPSPAVELSGTVDGFNYTGRGDVQSVMVKLEGKTIQLLLPPPIAMAVAVSVHAGDAIKATGQPELGLPDHPVYRGVSVTIGERTFSAPEPGRGAEEKSTHVEGAIKSLNYAPHGEVDGAILDSGDFVHTGPANGAIKLAIGEKLAADGRSHPMAMGKGNAIEADKVNGVDVPRPPRPEDGPREREPGNRGMRPDRDPHRGGPDGPPPPPRANDNQRPQRPEADGPDA